MISLLRPSSSEVPIIIYKYDNQAVSDYELLGVIISDTVGWNALVRHHITADEYKQLLTWCII
jgi:hypothetical protein